jgi:hypothetical protein
MRQLWMTGRYKWEGGCGCRRERLGKHKSRERWPLRPCRQGNGRRGDGRRARQAPGHKGTRPYIACMSIHRREGLNATGGGCGHENGQELIWVNIFGEELISVNFGEAYFSNGWSLFR